MSEAQPAPSFPSTAGPTGLTVIALLASCAVIPPEIHGLGLAAMGILTTLAVLTSPPAAAAASRWFLVAVPACIVAVRLALAPGDAVEPAVTWLLAALAGIAAAGASIPASILARLFGALLAAVSLRAIYEAVWGLPAWAEGLRDVPGVEATAVFYRLQQGRPYAGFITPAALGCFLAMTIPPVAAWAAGRTGRARVLGFSAVALGVIALIATRSVTAMAALAGALVLAAVRRRIPPRLFAGACVAIGLSIVTVGLMRPDAVFAPSRSDSPWRLRAGNVRIALEIARDHPFAGTGPAGYAAAYPQYRRPADNESRHAHCLPAELMAEWGIPVGLVLTGLFFWLFVTPVLRPGASMATLPSGLAIGLAAFALHNLVDFTAFLPSLLGMAAVARGLLAGKHDAPADGDLTRAAWIACAVALALAAAGSGLSREALFDARRAALEGDHADARIAATRAQRLAPWDADPPQMEAESRMAESQGDVAAALSAAERSVSRAPARASSRWTRARARSLAGDAAGAYADLVEASRLYPIHEDYAAQRDAMAASLRERSEKPPR